MKNHLPRPLAFLIILFILTGFNYSHAKNSNLQRKSPATKAAEIHNKSDLKNKINETNSNAKIVGFPTVFEQNTNQSNENVRFLARRNDYSLFLESDKAVFQFRDLNCASGIKVGKTEIAKTRSLKSCQSYRLGMKMLNANSDVLIQGMDELPTKSNYIVGRDSSKWLTGISNYQSVRYSNIYKGIDAVFRGAEQNLEYDFHIAPLVSPNLIQLEFEEVQKIKIDASGDLVFKFKELEVRHHQPVAYQVINGKKQGVSVKFVSLGKNKIGFIVGKYDESKELVIDPVVTNKSASVVPDELTGNSIKYATYLGGSRQDNTQDIAIDSDGYIYLASEATSEDFLNRESEVDMGIAHKSDIFITKLNPAGTQIIYNTVIGGGNKDIPWAIEVDDFGNVYVGGQTSSPDFPMVNARQTSNSLVTQYDVEGFVLKLNPSGSSPIYSTYHGATSHRNGYDTDWVESIDIDSSGNLYAVGETGGTDFPLKNGFQTSRTVGDFDAYLSKFSPSGELLYSTLYGSDVPRTYVIGFDVAVDNNGFAYLSGEVSYNSKLPITSNAYQTSGSNGYVAKFNTNSTGNSSLVYSTYTESTGEAIEIDSYGNAVTIGSGVKQKLIYYYGYGVKLNNTGTQALFKFTLEGGASDIAINKEGNIYLTENITVPENNRYSYDVKVVGYNPTGSLLGEVILKGESADRATGIALDANNSIYVVGYTLSRLFPTTNDALQPSSRYAGAYYGSSQQGFLARIGFQPEPAPLIFIPGIAGSTLYEADDNGDPIRYQLPDPRISELWTNGLFDPSTHTLSKLFLNPDSEHSKVVAVDAVRTVAPFVSVYKPLLDELKKDYLEYEIQGNPKKRNTQCTGEERYNGKKPTLFVFAYDWRLSGVTAAGQLKQYIDCVQRFHPDKKVNILTHSMGGLIARRYIIDHPADHKIDKLITTVAPFLGAPKGVDALFTGRFIGKTFLYGLPIGAGAGIYVYQDTIKELISYSKGAHQLLPSNWYYELGERPFGYKNSILQLTNDYTFTEANEILNTKFPSRPYDTANEFHDYQYASQDNWSFDGSGIRFYHIYGVQSWNITPSKVIATPFITYPEDVEQLKYGVEVKYSEGDGTVPAISAKRASFLLAPNATVKRCKSPSWFSDNSYDHNGITKNPVLWNEIKAILNDKTISQTECGTDYSSSTSGNSLQRSMSIQEANPGNSIEINSLKVYGVDRLQITDEAGNTNAPLGVAAEKSIPEIDYEHGSNSFDSFIFPHEVNFAANKVADIKFVAGSGRARIELFKGTSREESSAAIKYMDLQLPAGVTAWLRFTANGVENLRYDADGDGVFETEVQPTFHLTGAAANDRTEPNIDISYTVSNSLATVTVNSSDNETGINQIRYVINGENIDHIYNAPFTVNLTQSKLIYVSAEDNAGNRNLLAKWLDISLPNTTVTQTPAPNTNGWSRGDVGVQIKSLDDLGGAGIQSLTYSGGGVQNIPEETLSIKEVPFTFPQPSTATNFLAKSLTVNTEGVTNLTLFAKDKVGNLEATKTVAVKIDKTAPGTNGSYAQNGNQMVVTLASNDALSGVERISYSVDGGNPQTYTAPFAVTGNGNHSVTFLATDRAGNVEQVKTLSFTIVIINPVVSITSPANGAVYPVGTAVDFAGKFSGDSCSLHTAVWTFDDISQTGTVSESNGAVTASRIFTSAGVYFITLTVNNNCGGMGTASQIGDLTAMVVIYDPNGGFVTGGGWIDSPLGAYLANPNLVGKASFGFNSKYQKGAKVPTGNTEFQFRAANFNFKGTSYDWLVVAGAKAQYKGLGTINGSGNYGFMLTAIDGQINGGGGMDKFRIKIWDNATGNVVYDNQLGSSDSENPTTTIGGGSIIIHKQ